MLFDGNGRQYTWQGAEREDLQTLLRIADFIFVNNLSMEGVVQGKYQPYEFVTTFSGITFYDDDDLEVLFVSRDKSEEHT